MLLKIICSISVPFTSSSTISERHCAFQPNNYVFGRLLCLWDRLVKKVMLQTLQLINGFGPVSGPPLA